VHTKFDIYVFISSNKSIRENSSGNPEWISRDKGNIGHKRQERKQINQIPQHTKAKNMSNMDLTKNSWVNPSDREWYTIRFSYKTTTELLIVKSCKG